jgi:hypothetical protein
MFYFVCFASYFQNLPTRGPKTEKNKEIALITTKWLAICEQSVYVLSLNWRIQEFRKVGGAYL